MLSLVLWLLALPFLGAIVSLIFPVRKGWREAVAFLATLYAFILAMKMVVKPPFFFSVPIFSPLGFGFDLRTSTLSSFLVLFVALIGFLTTIYSIVYYRGREREKEFYAYLLGSVGASIGVLLANNFILFIFFWGLLLLFLYGLTSLGSLSSASHAMTVVGGADLLLLLGILILMNLTGTGRMSGFSPVLLKGGLPVAAFFLLVAGSLGKAGAFPFHSWIPRVSEDVPVPVMALLPASLDKLLGIYLLYRISFDFFSLRVGSGISQALMFIGSLTIMGGVLLALIQKNFKKLLSYHAVSQVGYMVLGIGSGIPLAVAGGLFHMINNSIYKSSLFLGGGAVEKRTGTAELEKLGGLGSLMPVTFVTFLIAAFSISGIPPFNGFFSKWMIYQGLVELGNQGIRTWIIWLVAAIFGSALTLASFIKVLHSVFLGKGKDFGNRIKEVHWSMWLPMVVLASLCVIFGIFAYPLIINVFLGPVVSLPSPAQWIGWWSPTLTTYLIIVGFILGGIIYLLSKGVKYRTTGSYIGGEKVGKDMDFSGVQFYKTLQEWKNFNRIYKFLGSKLTDFYAWLKDLGKFFSRILYIFLDRLVDYIWQGVAALCRVGGRILSLLHTGILPTYLTWGLVGMLILLLLMLGR
ncbi:MAG: hypothetical protein GXO71_07570 [Caldiserica bacterium]|nr:hypothetical protein [Caldisericota bacterium]